LDENLGATSVELTSDDVTQIDYALNAITIVGDRY
jgi:hypothetical protein